MSSVEDKVALQTFQRFQQKERHTPHGTSKRDPFHFFRRRILNSKLTTPFQSRSATIEMFRVMLYSTWMICWLETATLVL